jgi:hypothetical protein
VAVPCPWTLTAPTGSTLATAGSEEVNVKYRFDAVITSMPVFTSKATGIDPVMPDGNAGKAPSPTFFSRQTGGSTGFGPRMVAPSVTYWMLASQKVKPVAGLPSEPAEK